MFELKCEDCGETLVIDTGERTVSYYLKQVPNPARNTAWDHAKTLRERAMFGTINLLAVMGK